MQRFLDRVDRHLAALTHDLLRRKFLDWQIETWEGRYARFLATQGSCEPARDSADPPHAADFLLTIAGLARRRHALTTGETMRPTSQELDHAMRALLVTADQRCPAIIGQAHLLYHADAQHLRLDPAGMVAQLKRDAADLLDAIVAAEAALCQMTDVR